jgi:hypothetical protein
MFNALKSESIWKILQIGGEFGSGNTPLKSSGNLKK